ncbi:MAG: hypothetical protein RJA49_1066 [Actinomycetota bacterium]
MSTFDRRSFLLGGVAALSFAACSTLTSNTEPAGTDGPGGTRPGGNDAGHGRDPAKPFTSVVMVGDSITRASREELATAFTALGITDQVIDAEVGRRIEVGNGRGGGPLSGVRTVFNLLSEGADPDVWVIELGTNDVGSYATADAYGGLIDQILSELPADVPLVWQNTFRPQYLDATNVFNLVLQQRIAARPNSVVADWFGAASAPDAKLLRSDDLHPNNDGQRAMALIVAQAVQQL